MDKAALHIMDLSIDDDVLKRLEVTREGIQALAPRTWVEVVVFKILGDIGLVQDHLPRALDFHRCIADKASSHLRLNAGNIMRTPWLAAGMLSKDATKARAAAQSLVSLLAKTPRANRTQFEQGIFDDQTLWDNLVDFADARPAVCLWHGHGRFAPLFRVLAPRFLVAPDHILDCERQHARWQWLCSTKRSLKMPAMNAYLKLMTYLERNGGDFPDPARLQEHLQATISHTTSKAQTCGR